MNELAMNLTAIISFVYPTQQPKFVEIYKEKSHRISKKFLTEINKTIMQKILRFAIKLNSNNRSLIFILNILL